MMGADAPYPWEENCRRPEEPPAMTSTSVFPETVLAPPCLGEALRRGALPETHSSHDFHHPGMNLIMFMSVSTEQNF